MLIFHDAPIEASFFTQHIKKSQSNLFESLIEKGRAEAQVQAEARDWSFERSLINDLKIVMCTNFQENSAALKELLTENSNLKNFEISIPSKSVKVDLNELVDALCDNTTLRQLGVSVTIDSDIAKAFITVLQRNQTLKILNLRNSVIPRALAQQLVDADIRVVIDDDDIHL